MCFFPHQVMVGQLCLFILEPTLWSIELFGFPTTRKDVALLGSPRQMLSFEFLSREFSLLRILHRRVVGCD